MLVSMAEILQQAKEGYYGVLVLSAVDELSLRTYVGAVKEMSAPLIILCGWDHNKDMQHFGRTLRDFAIKASVPVAFMLDHSATFEDAVRGVHAGFHTIIVDCPSPPYEENVAQVKELVEIAHAAGVGVEAELGHVGVGENYAVDGIAALTQPDETVRYAKETGVDCLAVAIGSAHGAYEGEPKLRLDFLKELAEKAPVPLALHGGGGTGDENPAAVCRLGTSKVNVTNDLFHGAYSKIQEVGMKGNNIYALMPMLQEGYKETAKHFIKILGCADKAWKAEQCVSSGLKQNSNETE